MKAWRVEVRQGPAGQAKWLGYGLSQRKSETIGLQQRAALNPEGLALPWRQCVPRSPKSEAWAGRRSWKQASVGLLPPARFLLPRGLSLPEAHPHVVALVVSHCSKSKSQLSVFIPALHHPRGPLLPYTMLCWSRA